MQQRDTHVHTFKIASSSEMCDATHHEMHASLCMNFCIRTNQDMEKFFTKVIIPTSRISRSRQYQLDYNNNLDRN